MLKVDTKLQDLLRGHLLQLLGSSSELSLQLLVLRLYKAKSQDLWIRWL